RETHECRDRLNAIVSPKLASPPAGKWPSKVAGSLCVYSLVDAVAIESEASANIASCSQICRSRRIKYRSRDCRWIHEISTTASPSSPAHKENPLSSAVYHKSGYPSIQEPEYALRDLQVAKLFRHYIKNLAPWYDLNDSKRNFEDIVPIRARCNPLLLSATLAFAAANHHRTLGDHAYLEISEFYHYGSVRILISLTLISLTEDSDQFPIGETLAAICLLRSYEIITRRWIQIASIKIIFRQVNLKLTGGWLSCGARKCQLPKSSARIWELHLTADLHSAGYWKYLREDITVASHDHSLIQNAPLEPTDDAGFANYITFLLARIINRSLCIDSPALDLLEWEAMKADLDNWKYSLPSSFDVIETPGLSIQRRFLSIRTMRSWHVSTLHYYHTTMGILWLSQPATKPLKALQRIRDVESLSQKLEYHATEICALAFSSDSAPVWVNAFGP
ncbi:hypothetical protein N7517_008170, partial [Penicillium concentricum]